MELNKINNRKIMELNKMMKSMDRLSELPDSLIFKILSFLEIRDVVRTTLLSRRWKNLWTITPFLDFDESCKNSVQTRNFVNRVLLRWKGTEIRRFKINFSSKFDASLSGDIDFWMRFATEMNVEELYVYLPYYYRGEPSERNPVYYPPQCLYSCSSLTKLGLIGYNLRTNGNLQWDQLKSLEIHGSCMSEDVIKKVVSSTPQLEILDLCLFEMRENLSIRSSSLKLLAIAKHSRAVPYDPSNYAALIIWAPNLEALTISGAAYSTCLLSDVSSLAGVVLDFDDCGGVDVATGETLKQILPAIQHVEQLTLSFCCFKILGVMKGKHSFSVEFTKVEILNLSGGPIEPYDIVGLVEIFPKVKKLLIDWIIDPLFTEFLANLSQKHDIGENYLEPEAKNLKPFLMQLRTVEVTWYSYDAASIFRFFKFLLKHATMVEKIVMIHVVGDSVGTAQLEDMVVAVQELVKLQRSFPTVDVIFRKK